MQMKLRTLSLACTILVLGSAVLARQARSGSASRALNGSLAKSGTNC